MPESTPNDDNNSDWKYSPVDDASDNSFDLPETATSDDSKGDKKAEMATYNWSALDSFSVTKRPTWYLLLALVTVGVSIGIYLLTKDKITTAVIIVCGALIGFYGAKKPKLVNYEIDRHGFKVGDKYYNFGSFKSFSIDRHGDNRSAVLVPLRRFMPYMYINFTLDMEDKVSQILMTILPREKPRLDFIDNTLKRIGF